MMHLLQDRNQICGRKQVNFPRFFNGAKHKLHQIHWHGKVQFIIFNWTSRNKQTLVFDKNQYLMDMFGQHLPSLGLSILASHTMQESCYLVTCAEKNSQVWAHVLTMAEGGRGFSAFLKTLAVGEHHPWSHHKDSTSMQMQPPVRVGFKLATNGIQFYVFCHQARTPISMALPSSKSLHGLIQNIS